MHYGTFAWRKARYSWFLIPKKHQYIERVVTGFDPSLQTLDEASLVLENYQSALRTEAMEHRWGKSVQYYAHNGCPLIRTRYIFGRFTLYKSIGSSSDEPTTEWAKTLNDPSAYLDDPKQNIPRTES